MAANEDIGATGSFGALGDSDFGSSFPAPTSAPRPATNAPAATAPNAAATATAATPVAARQPGAQDIKAAVERANANLASSNRVLDFRVDAATGLTIAMIRNSQTGAVLQQIPGADMIALAKMLADWSPGKHMLLDLMA
jgi:flagellar protein FlaG